MKSLFIAAVFLLCISHNAKAQSELSWTTPLVVNSSTATDWPRVAVSNSDVVMVWGDVLSGRILSRRWQSGNLGSEIQLSPAAFSAAVFSLTGPDLKARGDTVYVTYTGSDGFHAYLQYSYNGGQTFSDTVQVDHIGDNYPQYPSVDLMQDGNPMVSFAKLDYGFGDPQYVVTKSADGGKTFAGEVAVTEPNGENPCDCCPGSIAYDNGRVAVTYRGAIDDLRDMRAALSDDGGASFDAIAKVDSSGWIYGSCPSIGGQAAFSGDTLISVFMNGLGGNNCYISTFHVNTMSLGFQKKLFTLPGGSSQNHPRLIAKGDTVAVVWEQVMLGHRYVMFSYSVTGASGIGAVVDTLSNVLPDGFHTNPDIAYADGKFHVVFADASAKKIYLMQSALYGTIGIEPVADDPPVVRFLNSFSGDEITIQSSQVIHSPIDLAVYSTGGTFLQRHRLSSLQQSQTIKLNDKLPAGFYLVSLSSNEKSATGKLVVSY